jgi:primosomal protein N' (replication factor Y)
VLGPAEAPLSRLKGRTRWQLFIKARSAHALRRLAREARPDMARRGGHGAVRVSIDVDPVSTL